MCNVAVFLLTRWVKRLVSLVSMHFLERMGSLIDSLETRRSMLRLLSAYRS